ncbi:MAG: type II secretion system secretin GspD [Steroidobacteraceae bacterium]
MKALTILLTCGLLALAGSRPLGAQQGGQRITPNFKDADITQIVEAVSAATGKNFIIDPRVRANVTMLSTTPMSPDAFYEAFLSILAVHGYVAAPSGNVIKIVPDANARQMPGDDLPNRISSTSDEIVTQVIAVRNVSAAQLVPIIRPLIPQQGHLAAYPGSNILIISDRANNVNRIMRIVQRIDQTSDAEIEVVQLTHASAVEVVRILSSLTQGQGADAGGGGGVRAVADERSNSILLSGDSGQRLRTRTLIAHLDTPLENGGATQVRYLRYADAEKIAASLKEQATGVVQAAAGGGQAGAAAAAAADRSTTIWAEPETNALVITAPPKIMRELMAVVDKLDIRRAQVLVEAIIVDVVAGKESQLGVSWAVDGSKEDQAVGGFLPNGGASPVINLANAALDPTAANVGTLPSGFLVGIGRLQQTGINFAAVLKALRTDTSTNIVATPSAVTMDNQEAELKVAREVPFLTGQFTNTGATNGSINPFQTIQRQEVGTILKVTPQINEGDSVLLKIEIESSSLEGSTAGGVANLNQITSKRSIKTNILIEDNGTVVLGGLLSDEYTESESRVPFLGRIPLIGELFRDRGAKKDKRNLMVFLKPRILRDGVDAAIETNAKYNYIRNEQQRSNRKFEVLPLLPGVKKPELPPGDPPPVKREAPAAPANKNQSESPTTTEPPTAEPQTATPTEPKS